MPWWNKKLYYDMHSNYNFYIDIDNDIVFKQKCGRFLEDVFVDHREQVFEDIINNENKVIKGIQNAFGDECSYKLTKKLDNMWNTDYKKQGYKFMSREKIFEEVKQILTDIGRKKLIFFNII